MERQIPERKRERWDTHTFYRTISHLHFTVFDSNNDMIDLMLVECESGKWFIEDSIGDLQDDRVFQPLSAEFKEPKFFDDSEAVEKAACKVAAEHLKLNYDDVYPYFQDE